MPVRRSFVLVTALAALFAATFAGGPASAGICVLGPSTSPDGQIAPDTGGPFVGGSIFNRGGSGQRVFEALAPGEVETSFAFFANDAADAADIVVTAKLTRDVGAFVVKITNLDGSKDFTDKILSPAGRKFHDVDAGLSTPDIRIRVKMKSGAPPNADLQVRLRGTFDVASPCGDTVKVGYNIPV